MSIYHKYTLTRCIPVQTVHNCSACGRRNIKSQYLKVSSVYTSKGVWTNRGIQKREESAVRTMDKDTDKLLEKAKNITAKSKFYLLNMDGTCSGCGHREPWGRMKLRPLEIACSVFGTIGAFCLIFTLFKLFDKQPLSSISPVVFVFIGLGLAAFIAKYGWILIQKIKVKKLPESSLPKVINL